jgi:8-oxo-dGTP pyrophosphatase MutT (NUDIX family)
MNMRRHGPWRIAETEKRFSSDFVEVYEDQVTRPDGSPGTYATVTVKPGVAVLAVGNDDQAHLTRQFRYAIGRDSVEVVSGGCDPDEQPLAAAQRELREELGLLADSWSDLGAIDPDTSIVRNPVHLFIARGLHKTRVDRGATEDIRPLTASLDEVVRMVMDGEITHAPSCVVILKAALNRSD